VRVPPRACWLLALLAAPVGAQEWAGIVKSVQGDAGIERAGTVRPAAVGSRLLAGDKLVTGKDGRLGATLRDDTLISTGPDSRIAVAEYAFEPATQSGSMTLSVLRGVAALVSGLVAKANPGAMRVTTPTATVGIRGTEFIVEVEPNE
jgi:hypothetical protein